MANKLSIIGRLLLALVVGTLAFVSGVWGALALWYQLPGSRAARLGAALSWLSMMLALLGLMATRHDGLPFGVYLLALASLLAWWRRIAPSNNRLWADDVARLLTGVIQGDRVTLHNVRNFHWRREDDYDVRWETREYDLSQLDLAEAVVSYWSSKAIAHAMISFGFSTGEHVVFSVEIRRRHGDVYSPIGGFFKNFETILVAADERDIIRVRTNVRGEDDYLYPLAMNPAAMRALFVSYVQAANVLARTPKFYHTITSNCTTIVYRMARQITPGLPWDPRLLMTGYLPEYLHDIGAVDRRFPVDELRRRARITERARRARPEDDFSLMIRRGENADKPLHGAERTLDQAPQ